MLIGWGPAPLYAGDCGKYVRSQTLVRSSVEATGVDDARPLLSGAAELGPAGEPDGASGAFWVGCRAGGCCAGSFRKSSTRLNPVPARHPNAKTTINIGRNARRHHGGRSTEGQCGR